MICEANIFPEKNDYLHMVLLKVRATSCDYQVPHTRKCLDLLRPRSPIQYYGTIPVVVSLIVTSLATSHKCQLVHENR